MRRTISFLLLFFYFAVAKSQPSDFSTEERIYKDDLRSVQFHQLGRPLSYPITDLSGQQLELSFDGLSDEAQDFRYTIVHCDATWQPSSEISHHDYIGGFKEDYIRIYDYSNNTLVPYVHYHLTMPNDNMRPTLSGNYVLLVYDDDEQLVLVRRFIVVKPVWNIEANLVSVNELERSDTHQELRFKIKGVDQVRNPRLEVTATVLQNFRWDNALQGIRPLMANQREISFEHIGKIVFAAGNEFRHADLMTLGGRSNRVVELYRHETIEAELINDDIRQGTPDLVTLDINGRFRTNNALESDYVKVRFSLRKDFPFEENTKVYVFGELSDWKIDERFEMAFDAVTQNYRAEVLLKQGFYNYYYVTTSKTEPNIPNVEETEGNSYRTLNEYIVIVYHRPFGQRYDSIIAYTNVRQ